MERFPILLYHRLVDNTFNLDLVPGGMRPYCLSMDKFVLQLAALSEHGFHGRSVRALQSEPLPENPLGITFDDGFRSDREKAWIELHRHGFSATFFIVTDFVGRKDYMDWEQIKELDALGMEIGSHSRSHPILITVSKEQIRDEITTSKKILEDRLGKPVDSFSIPYGFHDNFIISTAEEVGYQTICTSSASLTMKGAKIAGRFNIDRRYSTHKVLCIAQKQFGTLAAIQAYEQLKYGMKKTLGLKQWLRFREKILRRQQ